MHRAQTEGKGGWRGLGITAAMVAALNLLGACEDATLRSGGFVTVSAGSGSGSGGGATPSGGSGQLSVGSGDQQIGCVKVDFLFVIDNSVSMKEQQAALIASFPSFMETIQSTLSATSDYQIMVVDTDAETRCTEGNCISGEMGADALCVDAASGYACNTEFGVCDSAIGAGVTHPAGDGASNQLCELYGGNRYIVEGEPELETSFGCIARVGLAGHPEERPMDAMVAALAPGINDEGGCNAGFLRDDAILVITFISDDPNYEDEGTPQDWYNAVSIAKNGNTDSVVVLGMTPAFEGCGPAQDKPDKGQHWSEFIGLWGDHGLEASVCNNDFSSFFETAINIIDDACDDFEPK